MSLPKLQGPRRVNEPRNRRSAEDHRKYLESNICDNLRPYFEGCGREWEKDFTAIAKIHGKLNNNLALEFVESWSPEETSRVGVETLYERGIENAKEAFPDHSFAVIPHVNKNGCFHTHVLYCMVSDNGKRLYDKGVNRHRWNTVCDKRSREHGLSTVDRSFSCQRERLSREALERSKRGLQSYQLQIMKKADFARRIAVNIDEFVSFMGMMGVSINIRGEHTISYMNGSEKQYTRGRRIGLNYKMEGLKEQFSKNQKEFKLKPSFKKHLEQEMQSFFDDKGQIVGDTTSFPFHHGGHQKFENVTPLKYADSASKSLKDYSFDGSDSLYSSLSPYIEYASKQSIPDYCQKNGIALNKNQDGSFSLKGREHILIRHHRWENTRTKNGKKIGTKGSLIEFAANHKDISYLSAIAEITGNKKLLFLEQYLGVEKSEYKAFHVPKVKQEKEEKSKSLLGSLLKSFGSKSDFSRQLYKMKQVQVRADGVIRFLSGDAKGAVEFKKDKDGKWTKGLLGKFRSGVLKQTAGKKDLKVFKDMFSFLNETNGKGVMGFKSSDNLLVMGDDKMESIDFFLAQNPQVKHIELFGYNSRALPRELSLELGKRGVTFSFMDEGGKVRSRGLEI